MFADRYDPLGPAKTYLQKDGTPRTSRDLLAEGWAGTSGDLLCRRMGPLEPAETYFHKGGTLRNRGHLLADRWDPWDQRRLTLQKDETSRTSGDLIANEWDPYDHDRCSGHLLAEGWES